MATLLLAAWAAAFWLSEGLLQAVADASLVVSAVLALRGAVLPGRRAGPVRLALALAGLAGGLAAGGPGARGAGISPASLWLHALDTAALAAAALLGAQVVRWAWPEALFVAGGLLSLGLSMVQHLVRWSVPIPAFLRVPVDRVHETFGGEDRYAAGGFFFHRLRLAHASIAALGPALATALRPAAMRRRALAAALAGGLHRVHRPHLRPRGVPHRARARARGRGGGGQGRPGARRGGGRSFWRWPERRW